MEENKKGIDNEEKAEDEMETMYLTLDDDTELECSVVGIFDVDGKEYIALLPLDDEAILIYEYKEKGEEIELLSVESDEEFDKVTEAFNELFDEECDDEEIDCEE